MPTTTHKSACILCSINCGIHIEVDAETKQFVKITGDKDHPTSKVEHSNEKIVIQF